MSTEGSTSCQYTPCLSLKISKSASYGMRRDRRPQHQLSEHSKILELFTVQRFRVCFLKSFVQNFRLFTNLIVLFLPPRRQHGRLPVYAFSSFPQKRSEIVSTCPNPNLMVPNLTSFAFPCTLFANTNSSSTRMRKASMNTLCALSCGIPSSQLHSPYLIGGTIVPSTKSNP